MDDIDRGKKLGASTVITTWHWFPHAAALTNASIRAWQICSLTFKKERGGGLKTLNKESLGPTALLLWIVHDPADGRLHESTGTTSARPWRDGNEAFVLGAGAASQKVKIKTGSPPRESGQCSAAWANHYSSCTQRGLHGYIHSVIHGFRGSTDIQGYL